jgi:multimeric flavodoxin WrbA
MKVIGIGGSPRRGGNTDTLMARFLEGCADRGATTRTLSACRLKIAGCMHCDGCFAQGVCVVKDDMQMVYHEMEKADGIVISSPVQFMSVSAQLKALIDRCQSLWARKYILKIPPLGDSRPRKGFFLSVSGRRTVPNLFEGEVVIIKTLFHIVDVKYQGEILLPGIDAKGDILKHPDSLELAYKAGQDFAGQD